MCETFSGIVLRNGDLHVNPMTDSHEDLLAELGLLEADRRTGAEFLSSFVRVEFIPDRTPEHEGLWTDVDRYCLHIDEAQIPVWFTDEMQETVAEKFRSIVRRMIVDQDQAVLIGRCVILRGPVRVGKILRCRVIHAGEARIDELVLSEVEDAGAANVRRVSASVIRQANRATMWFDHAWPSVVNMAGRSMLLGVPKSARVLYPGDANCFGQKYDHGWPVP